jgi:TIR domain
MADIFISYSKADRRLAEALAADLRAGGVEVWWDHELYAGEDFHSTILAEIDRAKAVVVIWSDTAIASRWVRGEADHAAEQGKLIATHVPDFDLKALPLNFRALHTESVTDRDRILRAVQRLTGGCSGAAAAPPAAPARDGASGWTAKVELLSFTRSVIVIARQGQEHRLETNLAGLHLNGTKIADLQTSQHQTYPFQIEQDHFRLAVTAGLIKVKAITMTVNGWSILEWSA